LSYVTLYRKYRPQTFAEVFGQDVIVKILKNSILNNKIAHAYIFSGPRGTGKTSIAKIFAKAVNCKNLDNGDCCNKCDSCLEINKGSAADFFEIDGASNNGVDEIRDLIDKIKYLPILGKYKIYVIDEAHMLTTGAFNALLKTLEEPPRHAIFILATTEIHKIPKTILSRCQNFDFKNIDKESILKRLEEILKFEKIKIEENALKLIAHSAKGSLRDALTLLDQAISYKGSKILKEDIEEIAGITKSEELIKLLELIADKKIDDALNLLETFSKNQKDEVQIINDLIDILKDVLLAKVNYNKNYNLGNLKNGLTNNKIYHYLNVLIENQNNMKFTHQKSVYLQIAIIKMVNHEDALKIDLSDEISNLKAEIKNVRLKERDIIPEENEVEEAVIDPRENEKLVTINDILEILNNADKDSRNKIENILNKLEVPKTQLVGAYHLLKNIKVVAAAKNGAIFTHDDLIIANEIMQIKQKDFFEILKLDKLDYFKYFVIAKADWEIVRQKYIDLKQENRLSELNHDFKIYKKKKNTKKNKVQDPIISKAIELFGEDLVKIKN